MPERNRVAVIGAGAVGLMAHKNLKDDGFDVTGFESRTYLGGLWKDSEDGKISVHASTFFNTSKYLACTSDFPFSAEIGMFPSALEFWEYLNAYVDHFDIRRNIRVGHDVQEIWRENDEWAVQVREAETGVVTTHRFDRICMATGTFGTPRWPKFSGIEKFEGRTLHSMDYHGPEPFRDQNVLVVGMHASAQDTVGNLSQSAKQVYISHRHGSVLLPRYTAEGMPLDTQGKVPVFMVQTWLEANFPNVYQWLFDYSANKMMDKAYPNLPKSWGMKPTTSMAVSTPLLADVLYPLMESGFAEPVPEVKEVIGPKEVQLADGRVLGDIDCIIYCTGYHNDIPENLIPRSGASKDAVRYHPYPDGTGKAPRLYKNTFPLTPEPEIQNTLAFLGQAGAFFPGLLQSELQAMTVGQVWRGYSSLPPYEEMLMWHERSTARRNAVNKKYQAADLGTNYPVLLPISDWIPWLDAMAGTGLFQTFGGKFKGLFNVNAWKLWWQDRELYNLCTQGICSPLIFRLAETGGRKALSRDEVKRILEQQNEDLDQKVKARLSELASGVQAKKSI